MTEHRTGTREEWRKARVELLELEKDHTRRADELARMRRELCQLLDRAPKGRDEDNIPPGQWWWRRHDEYHPKEDKPP
jgi:predicted dithiol-disulfide oxidoreductase (DUF899 family)